MTVKNIISFSLIALILVFQTAPAQTVGKETYTLENGKVKFSLASENGMLASGRLEVKSEWASSSGSATPAAIETDADFALEIMYTDWLAPGKISNADNPMTMTKNDFILTGSKTAVSPESANELILDMKSSESTIDLRLTYSLGKEDFYIRKQLAVRDTAFGHHFLRAFRVISENVGGITEFLKNGGFGQPVAGLVKEGGTFFGLEYPTSQNDAVINPDGRSNRIVCGEEYGALIAGDWLTSDPAVEGITPDSRVKFWFFRYIDDIRVSPLRPYSLYNTWYDLRSPEYPKWSPEKGMSERTSLKMVEILRNSMIEKYNIKLDAFVLDDGWDVYESDWQLRVKEWPGGLKPLADELKKTNTSLGVWFGPTGGYSFRMKRVNWMKEHGYEVVGKTRNNSMLCLAGKKYGELLKKRVTDFVSNDGVGYYKWDGIQFSCSEPDHGHPVDIYSRRAVMQSLADMCGAVREKNPEIFLNITSGTWLSPWWVKYANTIWMQGMDYGFSDVPSISMRDGAITYRDFILYDDLVLQKFWFPIANLMTHGIIKGKHESVGTETEPLDKFTDDVLLYFARGVSMYELYISPDILSDGEWKSISQSMAWARDRFPVLMNTEMAGGNPMKGEPYAYAHFSEKRGIIAARNPVIESANLKVKLDPASGLDPASSSLVAERIYPTRWVSPKLYQSGESVEIELGGFETAVYEIYPLEEASEPLVAGVIYSAELSEEKNYTISFHGASREAKILNPSLISSASPEGKKVDLTSLSFKTEPPDAIVTSASVRPERPSVLRVTFDMSRSASEGTVAVLLTPDSSIPAKAKPTFTAAVNGQETAVKTEPQEGRSQWYVVGADKGKNDILFNLTPGNEEKSWKGKASVWLIANQKEDLKEISFSLKSEVRTRPMPPLVWPAGETRKNVKLGECELTF